jgi:hypothetical protein
MLCKSNQEIYGHEYSEGYSNDNEQNSKSKLHEIEMGIAIGMVHQPKTYEESADSKKDRNGQQQKLAKQP